MMMVIMMMMMVVMMMVIMVMVMVRMVMMIMMMLMMITLYVYYNFSKVTHKKTGRKYAMKVVKKELVNDDEVWRLKHSCRRMF